MQKLIYIADDEQNIRMMMKTFLENEGYAVEVFGDGYSIRKAVREKMPDMIILDVMMPGEDGLSLCTSFRKESRVPIMIVSAKDSPMDRVTGITMGSDDYISKPFLPLELIARVKALFRRSELSGEQSGSDRPVQDEYECGNLRIYRKERKVYAGDEAFTVTPTEFEFLLYLIERKEAAVSKKELLEQIWGCKGIQDEMRMPDDLVKRLRKKLKQKHVSVMVETVWGYGYRLTQQPVWERQQS